jgi:hypothetical protein
MRTAPLFLLLALACADGRTGPGNATLEVVVTRGPLNPAVREGDVDSAPVPGARVEVAAAGGRAVARAETDANGVARIALDGGRYTVAVRTCPGAMSLPAAETVEVLDGAGATVALSCDTGIR